MNHICVKISANEAEQEYLIAQLEAYNPTGFEQIDNALLTYFTESDYNALHPLLALVNYPYETSKVEECNWNEEWESGFQPIVVEDFCAVRAHFHQPVTHTSFEVIITPKMSFGTGHHPTTYLMMLAMRDINFGDRAVFDFGTGTGILAILAQKLGGKSIAAIDVDEWSVTNSAENFERNNALDISLAMSTDVPSGIFDVILANINLNVILEYMPRLSAAMSLEGIVLFSGLLVRDEQAVTQTAHQHHLQLLKRFERDGWIALQFAKAE